MRTRSTARPCWRKLTDRERQIVREKGQERMSWPSAAVACGGTPAEGERLRRRQTQWVYLNDECRTCPIREAATLTAL